MVAARGADPVTAGAIAHGANRWQSRGYRGAGVRIGVFDIGVSDYSRHIGSALPTPSGVLCYTRDVNVQHTTLRACETASATGHGATVTEMVYDVAPEAEYFLATGAYFNDLNRAVDWFNSHDVDVLVVSLSTIFEGPGDGTSVYTGRYIAAINRAVAFGMTVAVSAGNDNGRSWFGSFVDSDNDRVLDWADSDEMQQGLPRFRTHLRVQIPLGRNLARSNHGPGPLSDARRRRSGQERRRAERGRDPRPPGGNTIHGGAKRQLLPHRRAAVGLRPALGAARRPVPDARRSGHGAQVRWLLDRESCRDGQPGRPCGGRGAPQQHRRDSFVQRPRSPAEWDDQGPTSSARRASTRRRLALQPSERALPLLIWAASRRW